MTPTNQDIVNAAKRAGIPVDPDIGGGLGIFDDTGLRWAIAPTNNIGSALFIVAVLGVLPRPIMIETGPLFSTTRIAFSGPPRSSGWCDTLTAACMAAIVAAYPEEVGE